MPVPAPATAPLISLPLQRRAGDQELLNLLALVRPPPSRLTPLRRPRPLLHLGGGTQELLNSYPPVARQACPARPALRPRARPLRSVEKLAPETAIRRRATAVAANAARGARADRGRPDRAVPALQPRGALSESGSSRTGRRGCAVRGAGWRFRRSARGRRARQAACGTSTRDACRGPAARSPSGPLFHSRADRGRSGVVAGSTSFCLRSSPSSPRARVSWLSRRGPFSPWRAPP